MMPILWYTLTEQVNRNTCTSTPSCNYLISQSCGSSAVHKSMQIRVRIWNADKMWSKWLWQWNDCWCQTGWFEHLRNCWSPGILGTMGRARKLPGNWVQMSMISVHGVWTMVAGGTGNHGRIGGLGDVTVVCQRASLNRQRVKPLSG